MASVSAWSSSPSVPPSSAATHPSDDDATARRALSRRVPDSAAANRSRARLPRCGSTSCPSAMPSVSSARPWLSSEGSLRDQPLSAPRKFRKRRSAGSNAAPRNRSERQALSSTAPQPSSCACARSTSSARRDVVRAVPERVVRDRSDRVLPDPERPRDRDQVRTADRIQRSLSHRSPRGLQPVAALGRAVQRLRRRSRHTTRPPRARSCRGCRRRLGVRSPHVPPGSRAAARSRRRAPPATRVSRASRGRRRVCSRA